MIILWMMFFCASAVLLEIGRLDRSPILIGVGAVAFMLSTWAIAGAASVHEPCPVVVTK